MSDIAKIIIVLGLVLILVGSVMLVIGKIPGIGKLPGDIVIKKDNFTFYFPLMSCLLVSVILTIISCLWSKR